MTGKQEVILYGVSALALAAFAPVLSFRDLAGAAVILVGLGILDLIQFRRRQRAKSLLGDKSERPKALKRIF